MRSSNHLIFQFFLFATATSSSRFLADFVFFAARTTSLPVDLKLFGYPLEWEELPEARDCPIACYLNDVDRADEKDWPRQHEWLAGDVRGPHRFTQKQS